MDGMPSCEWDRTETLRRMRILVKVLRAIAARFPERKENAEKRVLEALEIIQKLENSSESL